MPDHRALHLGIDVRDLLRVEREISGAALVAGDGWEAWGEPVGSAGNDDTTLHLVARLAPETADQLVAELSETLIAMSGSTVVAVETPMEDWSVAETGGRIWHRIQRLDGTLLLVVEQVSPEESRASPSSGTDA